MPGGKSSYPTYMWDIAKLFILSHTPHWDTPVGRLRCQFVPPPSKYFYSLSSWFSRPRPLYVLHFHSCQFQTHGEMALPFRKTLSQLDQVRLNTRTIKELSRELWELLPKAKRPVNHTRYTSFSHISRLPLNWLQYVSDGMQKSCWGGYALQRYAQVSCTDWHRNHTIIHAYNGGGAHHIHRTVRTGNKALLSYSVW